MLQGSLLQQGVQKECFKEFIVENVCKEFAILEMRMYVIFPNENLHLQVLVGCSMSQ